jgi:hypothetical protein
MQPKLLIIILLVLIILTSFGVNVYLYYKYRVLRDSPPAIVDGKCPEGLICKDFQWVNQYIEVISGEINWIDCGEGENKCARWEDYSRQNPLPQVLIKKCPQEGTRIVDNEWVTGLPEGTHTLIGITLRPCEDIVDAVGILSPDQSE